MARDVVGEHNGATIIYTNPTRSMDMDIASFRTCFEPYRNRPWIWIVDCAGLTAAHVGNLKLVRAIVQLIDVEHAASLQHVWLVNMNTFVRPLLQMFPQRRTTVLPRDRLEIFVLLQRAGYSHKNVDLFLTIAATPSQTPAPYASIDK